MPSLPAGYAIGPMVPEEIDQLGAWATEEGWNPGRHDLAIARRTDPDAFIALRRRGELVGGGSIFRHHDEFGFMGLFIVRKDVRGTGLGALLWQWRLAALRQRLAAVATIGMDGVCDMVPFYTRGGFRFAHRDLRFEGVAPDSPPAPQALSLNEVPFEQLLAFDAEHFPGPRPLFLQQWLFQPDARGFALRAHGALCGYGLARRCHQGFKLGPVFAQTPLQATQLLQTLCASIAGEAIQMDIPEPNEAGLALASTLGLQESFSCARLYCGPDPALRIGQIFGVTSFEFG